MSILIKGMEMPKTCCQCDLKIYDNEMRWDENGIEQIGAWVCKRTREIIWNTQRGENCPLVPLPEKHGRLGDLGSIKEKLLAAEVQAQVSGDPNAYLFAMGLKLAEKIVDGMNTIIPAEGGGEDG